MGYSSKTGVILGLISGFAGIILYWLLYQSEPQLLFKGLGIFSFLLVVVFMIITGIATQKKAGGQASFRQLLKPVFITFLLFMAMLSAFQYLMYNHLAPDMAEQYRLWSIERETQQLQKAGESDKVIAERSAEWQEKDMQLTIMTVLQRFVFFLIPGFFTAAFITFFIRAFGRLPLNTNSP